MCLITFVTALNKEVSLNIDGNNKRIQTKARTLGELIKSEKVVLKGNENINISLNKLLKNNDNIEINSACNVVINVAGEIKNIETFADTIGELLIAEKITLGQEDVINFSKETKISPGMNIDIQRVETKYETQIASIDFETVVEKSNELTSDRKKVRQEGENGERQITTKTVLVNGNQVLSEVTEDKITKKPRKKVVLEGIRPIITASRGGEGHFGRRIAVKTTAYYALNGVGKTYTASGRKAVRDPNGYSTVAVDPTVFPFGTKMFIEGYGYAVAADKGSAIKGNIIDVFFDTYQEAVRWGARYVNASVVE